MTTKKTLAAIVAFSILSGMSSQAIASDESWFSPKVKTGVGIVGLGGSLVTTYLGWKWHNKAQNILNNTHERAKLSLEEVEKLQSRLSRYKILMGLGFVGGLASAGLTGYGICQWVNSEMEKKLKKYMT